MAPKFPLPPVGDSIRPFLQKVLDGEYALPERYKLNGVSTILDIGANIGAFSYWARQTYPDAKIHAYEPHPDNFAAYQANMAACEISNFVINNTAVTVQKECKLYTSIINSGMHSVSPGMAGPGSGTIDCAVTHPDDLPNCDFMKLDCEGPEFEILNKYLRNHPLPTIIALEYHSEEIRHAIDHLLQNDYMLIKSRADCHQVGVNIYITIGSLYGAKQS